MIEAPTRPIRKSITPPVVDALESVVTQSPVLEANSGFVVTKELVQYLLNHPTLVLCERPATGACSVIHDLLKESGQCILIVTSEPTTLLEAVNADELICDADVRFRRSTLIADASRFLQSQLTSEQTEQQADAEREVALHAVKTRLEAFKNQTAVNQELAGQRVQQSVAWLQHLAVQRHQNGLRSQIETTRSQLQQPVGFLQRLLGRGTAADQLKQLSILEAELLHLTLQLIPEADLFKSLLAAELEQIQMETHALVSSLQAELVALPVPKLSKAERERRQAELDTRVEALPLASEEYVWANRRIVIVSPIDLADLDLPGHFDKWILDVPDAAPEYLRQCNRLGRSGLFFGEVSTLRPPGYRNGSLPTTTLFDDTWNERVTDFWAFEGTCLLAQAVRLPNAARAELKPEAIIGIEQHEVRLHDNGTDLTLAEVAFAPGTCFADATRLLIDVAELACLTTIGPPEWTLNSGKHTARWLSVSECESTSVAEGSVELRFCGYQLAQAQFDPIRFPTQTEAEVWLSDFVRCSAPACVRTRVV